MDKQKNYRKNYGVPFFSMAFLAAGVFEFYWIMSNPYDHFMLIGIGIIMIITGYLTIDSLLKIKADSDAEKAEQNDMILKAQKAIYIATKKNAKDAEVRQAQSVKAMELMMNKMITSQQALLEDKKSDGDDMTSLIDQLSASNAKLAKEVQSAITVNQLVKANADLVKNVKEALNANTMSASQTADLSAYVSAAVNTPVAAPEPVVVPPTPVITPQPVVTQPTPMVAPQPAIVSPTPAVTPEPVIIPEVAAEPEFEPIIIPEVVAEPEPEPIIIPDIVVEPDPEPIIIPDIVVEPDPEPIIIPDIIVEPESTIIENDDIIPSASDLGFDLNELDMATMPNEDGDFDTTMDEIENEINLAQMAESIALEDITIPDEMTPELDAAIDDGSDIMVDTIGDDDLVTNDTPEEINPFASKVDDSPNRQLTEEEIAALFASL